MTITSVFVVFAVSWFLTLFIVLPIGLRTQGDVGEIVPGTPASAPADFNAKRTMLLTTIWATVVWAVVCGIILSGVIKVRDFDFFHRMNPPIERPEAQVIERRDHTAH
ncbi:DUF1467 family protein [Ketogulonicigenium vulgare]|uniref:Uncharacterized protein n=1 Tax=Ketogulonicigenium vulgare (strain WSH-001) TaxID=759362 RepID=F9Y8T8_KETVW|nr:DUF1467 family protein [Ketogulonicigenium vulgare]ADO41416.1 conserved hypothetical protein [Ketogulonicigenium vulgare Y25]AEM42415.1 hypothetical protein KVU_2576 [Ketogulonicigenium vulgare WSH-001]ALJ80033.1 hypothetical protein KVH_01840 [Ketogulonicigenium vulgare]ANW32916.1 hypothetical protein KvSKV_01840 [Ketogulonicigenium vulgare]AOZ53500.1 hypothetical protein KVC_0474 [Ketogulonicigenium vulgare]